MAPEQYIASPEGTSANNRVQNPEYITWFQRDQFVLSALLSSLTEEILGHVLFMTSAADVWAALEGMFASRSRARQVQIRFQLANLRKKDLSVSDYFQKMKNLADMMASIGQPLKEEETVSYILAGLGEEFDAFVTSMTTRSEEPSLSDLYAQLLSYEMRREHTHSDVQISSSANSAARGGGRFRGNGGRGRGRGRGTFGRGQQQFQQHYQQHHDGANRSNQGGGSGARLRCQICGKTGHDAIRCYHRFNHAYQVEDARVAAAAASGQQYQVDTNWYIDSGATDHMTSELDRLSVRDRYRGGDQIQVANGAGQGNEEASSLRQN